MTAKLGDLTFERVEALAGGMAVVFRDGPRVRRWRVTPQGAALLVQAMAATMAAGGMSLGTTLEAVSLIADGPHLGLKMKDWPHISVGLSDADLLALSTAALRQARP